MPQLLRHHLDQPRRALLFACCALAFSCGLILDEGAIFLNQRLAVIVLSLLLLAFSLLGFHLRRVYLARINSRASVMEPKDTARALHGTP